MFDGFDVAERLSTYVIEELMNEYQRNVFRGQWMQEEDRGETEVFLYL